LALSQSQGRLFYEVNACLGWVSHHGGRGAEKRLPVTHIGFPMRLHWHLQWVLMGGWLLLGWGHILPVTVTVDWLAGWPCSHILGGKQISPCTHISWQVKYFHYTSKVSQSISFLT
jgi:hypothetical protein